MRQTSMWLRGAGREPRPLPHPAPTPPAAAGPAAGRWGRPAGCRRAGRGRRRAGAGRPASHPGWPCRRGRRQGRSGRARALQILAAANERRSRRGRRPPPGRLTCLSVGPAPVLTTPGRCSIWARELSLAGSRELMAEPRGPSSGDQLSAPVTTCQPRCMAGLGAAVGWLGGLGCVGRTGKEWPGGQRSGPPARPRQLVVARAHSAAHGRTAGACAPCHTLERAPGAAAGRAGPVAHLRQQVPSLRVVGQEPRGCDALEGRWEFPNARETA